MSTKDLHAVIFSGGGADGAYQLGVARALFNGRCPATYGEPLDPDVFTGTSIGSFNASFLVSQWEDFGAAAVGNLEKVWLERVAQVPGQPNGGFRLRFNPFDALDPRLNLRQPVQQVANFAADVSALGIDAFNRTYNLFTSSEPLLQRLTDFLNLSSFVVVEPWERTIRESIDFKKIRGSAKKLRIAATNWAFGEVREFKNRDMTDKLGPAAIRASSSIPGFYPPAEVGAQTYVDGAVLMNTPLSPAIAALRDLLPPRETGSETGRDEPELVLHVIYMNTEVEKMPIAALQSTLQTLYRTQIISWAAAVNRDIARAKNLNEGLEIIRTSPEEAERMGLHGAQLRILLESAMRLKQALERGRRYKRLTIHRYFPPDGLDGALGFLDVRLDRIKRLIDEGFFQTVSHDCAANQCVLAGRHKVLGNGE